MAVIGTGLRQAYPPQNAALQERIAAEHAVVSRFWPDAPPTRRSFPMRNAVMSGMTLATVIVEASETSGSRVQSRLALAQGRPVFVLEPLLDTGMGARARDPPGHLRRQRSGADLSDGAAADRRRTPSSPSGRCHQSPS